MNGDGFSINRVIKVEIITEFLWVKETVILTGVIPTGIGEGWTRVMRWVGSFE